MENTAKKIMVSTLSGTILIVPALLTGCSTEGRMQALYGTADPDINISSTINNVNNDQEVQCLYGPAEPEISSSQSSQNSAAQSQSNLASQYKGSQELYGAPNPNEK